MRDFLGKKLEPSDDVAWVTRQGSSMNVYAGVVVETQEKKILVQPNDTAHGGREPWSPDYYDNRTGKKIQYIYSGGDHVVTQAHWDRSVQPPVFVPTVFKDYVEVVRKPSSPVWLKTPRYVIRLGE